MFLYPTQLGSRWTPAAGPDEEEEVEELPEVDVEVDVEVEVDVDEDVDEDDEPLAPAPPLPLPPALPCDGKHWALMRVYPGIHCPQMPVRRL